MLCKLNSLVLFRGLRKDPVLAALCRLCEVPDGQEAAQIDAWAAFAAALLQQDTNLSRYILQLVLADENLYTDAYIAGEERVHSLDPLLQRELKILEAAGQFTGDTLPESIRAYCPCCWQTEPIDYAAQYRQHLAHISETGFGIFARFDAFTVEADGRLTGIRAHNVRRLEQMYSYDAERRKVLANTAALVEGRPACNVLLYGDAGTGKSSTVKAVASHFSSRGLRLIELPKSRIGLLPQLVKRLESNPLKFIVFIDDVIFSPDDPDFCLLKTVLDGDSAGLAPNMAVYVTSNHRHLVKESAVERSGAVSEADHIQSALALASRFGITVTFLRPERREYENIIYAMAAEKGIQCDRQQLLTKAEAYAIRNGGRTPRTAQQFIDLVAAGVEQI